MVIAELKRPLLRREIGPRGMRQFSDGESAVEVAPKPAISQTIDRGLPTKGFGKSLDSDAVATVPQFPEITEKIENWDSIPDNLLYQLCSALLEDGVQRVLNPYNVILTGTFVDNVNRVLWDIRRRSGNHLFDLYLVRRRDLKAALTCFANDPDEFLRVSGRHARLVLEPFRNVKRVSLEELFDKLLPAESL